MLVLLGLLLALSCTCLPTVKSCPVSHQIAGSSLNQLEPNISIEMLYVSAQGSQVQQPIYADQILQPSFSMPKDTFACNNLLNFILTQSAQQFQNNSQYYITLGPLSQPLQISLSTKYQSPSPSLAPGTCAPPQCTLALQNNCALTGESTYNLAVISLASASGQPLLQFQYNFVCNSEQFDATPIEWGALVLVLFSILLIFVASKFQQAKSFSNVAYYVNYPVLVLYCTGSIIKFALIQASVSHIVHVVNVASLAVSALFCCLGFSVMFSEGADMLGVRWLRWGYGGRLKFRVMDVLGFGLGAGAFCGWYFSGANWIVGNIIFIVIFIAIIKLIKFDSLKIALVNFVFTLAIDVAFIIVQSVTHTSKLQTVDIFNNPLFLVAPILARVPNQRCIWYFILSMAYPGMFLAYLERFDRNRESIIYAAIFIVCYSICSMGWFVVSSIVPFDLPYDLFTVPISMGCLLLYANRRGELSDLWTGRFFDVEKQYYENELEMKNNLKVEKTASAISYDREMFNTLRYEGTSSRGSMTLKSNSLASDEIKASSSIKGGELKELSSRTERLQIIRQQTSDPTGQLQNEPTNRLSLLVTPTQPPH